MAAPIDSTETGMANRALALIGEPRISSLDDPKRKAARDAKANFADVRDRLLREIPWQFAESFVTPAALPAPPPSGYAYRYAMPADCVSVTAVGDAQTNWQVVSSGDDTSLQTFVDANDVAPPVVYTRRVVNPAQWDEIFAETFVIRLAARLNPLIGRDKSLTAALKQDAQRQMDDAALRDGQQRANQTVTRTTSWVAARWGVAFR